MKREYEEVLEEFENIISRQEIEFESYDSSELIEGKITFINGWRLQFLEFKANEKHKYRFHLMNDENEMILRWDTAPHHRELDNFPFHRHTGEGVESTEEYEGKSLVRETCEKVLEAL